MGAKTIFILFCGLSIVLAANVTSVNTVPQDSSAADSTKIVSPDFEGVDVIVETEWGTTDKTEDVDVFIRKTNGGRTEIVMKKSAHQECIIELVSGLKVKIIDRKTGKVLKRYKK